MNRKLLYLAEFVFFVFVLAGCGQKGKTQEDYEDYLQKIWVVEDWHGEKYRYHAPFSFIITNIEGENIEGSYSNLSILDNVGYLRFSHLAYTGIIEGGMARCTLYDSDNQPKDAGTLELTFLDSRRIEGKFMEEGKVQWKYVFRPYTLNDIEGLHITKRFQEEINTLGEISIAVGTEEYQSVGGSHFTAPVFYIINESDDILYEFPIGSQAASEFYEMDVADYNEDGLDDIKIVTYFPYEEDSVLIERIFYQTEEHLFYQVQNKVDIEEITEGADLLPDIIGD